MGVPGGRVKRGLEAYKEKVIFVIYLYKTN